MLFYDSLNSIIKYFAGSSGVDWSPTTGVPANAQNITIAFQKASSAGQKKPPPGVFLDEIIPKCSPIERPSKRSLDSSPQYAGGTKRQKSASEDNNTYSIKYIIKDQTPIKLPSQLLQQLIKEHGPKSIRTKMEATNPAAWVPDGGGTVKLAAIQVPREQEPVKDSVLMNLLVSGCDVSAGYICMGSGKVGCGTNY